MKAFIRQIRISSKKVNLVAALVRRKSVTEAIDLLTYTPKASARVMKKLIESAVANAEHNFKQERENLFVKEIIVNEGATYKRSMPVSRGRAFPILKRTSHITVKLEAKAETEQSEKKEVVKKKAKTPKK